MPRFRMTFTAPVPGTTKHGAILEPRVLIDLSTGTCAGQFRYLITDPERPGYQSTPQPEDTPRDFLFTLPTTDLAQLVQTLAARAVAQGVLHAATSAIEPDDPIPAPDGLKFSLAYSEGPLAPGATRQFTPTISGAADLTIKWEALDQGGGTIDATGLYTAPATPGKYRVSATPKADPSKAITVTVAVRTPPPAPAK